MTHTSATTDRPTNHVTTESILDVIALEWK
jgi:hypothetical protein